MEFTADKTVKYTFSGHDSFQCRQFWLKKGYDFAAQEQSFSAENAVVTLGVGKNMVSAIRYWLRSFFITQADDRPTALGAALLGDDGFDPFLEDDGSLWLLHYHLVTGAYASVYSLVFNELRREKIEFSREQFLSFMKRKAETNKGISFNPKTLADDFDVFRKMYLQGGERTGDDGFNGLLSELDLITKLERRQDQKKEEYFVIENKDRRELPVQLFLYAVLSNPNYGTSIGLNSLEQDYDSPGAVFAMNRLGIIEKIQEAQQRYDWLNYNDNAGVKELQFRHKPEPITLLADHYDQV